MTNLQGTTPTLDPIKSKHRAMWALGDYDRIATEVIPALGSTLVSNAGIGPGMRVLDVAAGSGNASFPAAAAGAFVTATDLTPELLQIGAQRSDAQGLDIKWQEADAEHLPFATHEFDATISCVADELARVTRPGGTIALANWTPEGFVGQMFATMKPFVAAPPSGAMPPPLWGDEPHVRTLFAESTTELTLQRRTLPVTRFSSASELRDFFAAFYGPTIAAYRNVAGDSDRTAALDQALLELAEKWGAGAGHMEWEYLLVLARAD
jgi:SAM-dependent methyltransferase